MSRSINDILSHVLNANGIGFAGLAGGTEVGLPLNARVPVPRNILKANGSSGDDIIRVASWSYNQYIRNNTPNTWESQSVILAWMTGCVALNEGIEESEIFREAVVWDAEVHFVDGEVTGLGTPLNDDELATMLAPISQRPVREAILTVVVACKMTWWTTNHHLGVRASTGVTSRTHHGFIEKAVRSLEILGLDWDSEEDRTRIYHMAHFWSSKRVMAIIFESKQFRRDLKPAIPMPKPRSKPRNGAFAVPVIAQDVIDRTTTFGAGYAALADIRAAIAAAINHPLAWVMPGWEKIPSILREYATVRTNPFQYGIASTYLSKTTISARFAKEDYQDLIAGLASWLSVYAEASSLRRAQIFSGPPSAIPGYSSTYLNACTNFHRASAHESIFRPEVVSSLVTMSGAASMVRIDDTLMHDATEAGIHINRAAVTGYQTVLDASFVQPQAPPADAPAAPHIAQP
ncbi:hypothetical protein [Xinzhou nematode virus 3]|uniref:Uncharacterized protein n=1 Tax=Xinzhou nematode virus 3 TaxID=1923771 RepID=A0A1L3KL38_9VIRU|nr:hypothetical protein [Xinzhou nematode virus 3]APG78082.1 hypothetical protein [Xinzhou nematode virus 3]